MNVYLRLLITKDYNAQLVFNIIDTTYHGPSNFVIY